jgi:hypothetical protein
MSRILLLFTLFRLPALGQHQDLPFIQDFSVKYYLPEGITAQQVASDRNDNFRILTNEGIFQPTHAAFLHPGSFVKDEQYRTAKHKKIHYLTTLQGQFVYMDEKHIFSQAWAGTFRTPLPLERVRAFAGSTPQDFIMSDGTSLAVFKDENPNLSETRSEQGFKLLKPSTSSVEKIKDIQYHGDTYYILRENTIQTLKGESLETIYRGQELLSMAINPKNGVIYIGTKRGLIQKINNKTETLTALPSLHLNHLAWIGDKLWAGTPEGAFTLSPEGKINYYAGERWLPSDTVLQISKGPKNSVLVLTNKGIGQIHFQSMTLKEKAAFFQEQVRSRHIRNGLNATLAGMKKGDITTGYLSDSDNDGLWTSMYLAAEALRFTLTQEEDAKVNTAESLAAMERLFTVHHVPGFPARSFERTGFKEILSDPERWQTSHDKIWDWKATTSSDEAIGHMFAYGLIAELVPDEALKKKAILLMDTLMSHIVKHDLYLIDHDGQPTLWGKWNPSYVNGFPTNVGDRKLNSSNIISMLQTAYRFTGKRKYKDKALELLHKEGYLENLMRPMKEIGETPKEGDSYAQMLSEAWNHSDDEMYFLGYWGLYRYALNDTLREQFKKSILDHWEAERPEKEGLWNLMTAVTGEKNIDLPEAIWYLQEHPLDLITWDVKNSHRKDIKHLPANFRRQSTEKVLPPDERPIQRHNANMFTLDRGRNSGTSEYSAGDIWLLPYWLGRYFGQIID